ncbi:hypothetical protein BKA70DRAFT_1260788 [Coprinopsis sp. MPI-PUGE-AT-0042]|nr:hypothetical protein BKA70DRAFT_1260788 [Coprinopsis sp. MPI-PUGE-AT-0042]
MLPTRLREGSSHDASPSISLERGTYRMRPPRNLRPIPLDFNKAEAPASKTLQRGSVNRHLSTMLGLLTLACITCFGFAYYLFTTRCGIVIWRNSSALADTQTQAPVKLRVNDLAKDLELRTSRGERLMAYLPHSGFHNQRIAFENALLLARLLNRTLLAPPILFADKPTRYLQFDTLLQTSVLSGRDGLQHCAEVPQYLAIPAECLYYFDSTTVRWNQLFDLSGIEAMQRIVYLDELSPFAYLHDRIPADAVLTVPDEHHYQYCFTDENISSDSSSRYDTEISIRDLWQSDSLLLQLGSLFGSHRLVLNASNDQLLDEIQSSFVVKHPSLVRAQNLIAQSLGSAYLGAHLRVGDGSFYSKRHESVVKVYCTLLQYLGIKHGSHRSSEEDVSCPVSSRHTNNLDNDNPWPVRHKQRLTGSTIPPTFISTDIKDPHSNPLLQPILRAFPDTFFLTDFHRVLDDLHDLRNFADGVPLDSYILPLLDAMVVANATFVVGTEGSTFSKYVEKTLWPAYHSFSS